MNENHENRVLRFEPLESRSLLAGNLFAGDDFALDLFADSTPFSETQRNVQASQMQEVRPIGNDNGRNVLRPDRPNPPNFDRGLIQNVRFNFNPQTFVVRTLIQDQQSQPSPTVEVANRLSLSAVDAAIAAITAGELDTDVRDDLTSAVAGDSSRRPLQNSVTETAVIQRQLTPLTPDPKVTNPEPTDGLIELSPLNLDLSLDDPLDESRLPWQLDTEVLPHIRSVIERASNRRTEVIDAEIASWFGGPYGMIEVDRVLLPTSPIIAAVDWLDVQLESTVKLHRSLELIASGKATPLSDVALDTIMASLAEIAESEAQPINSIHSFEIPKLAYLAIAVLSVAAIASRRKHKHPDTVTLQTPNSRV